MTPSPRLVLGRLRTAFSPSLPRSGNVSSPLATNADASSGFFAGRFFFLARGNVGVAPALAAGPRGTTAARNGERGPNMPDRRYEGVQVGSSYLESGTSHCKEALLTLAAFLFSDDGRLLWKSRADLSIGNETPDLQGGALKLFKDMPVRAVTSR